MVKKGNLQPAEVDEKIQNKLEKARQRAKEHRDARLLVDEFTGVAGPLSRLEQNFPRSQQIKSKKLRMKKRKSETLQRAGEQLITRAARDRGHSLPAELAEKIIKEARITSPKPYIPKKPK